MAQNLSMDYKALNKAAPRRPHAARLESRADTHSLPPPRPLLQCTGVGKTQCELKGHGEVAALLAAA